MVIVLTCFLRIFFYVRKNNNNLTINYFLKLRYCKVLQSELKKLCYTALCQTIGIGYLFNDKCLNIFNKDSRTFQSSKPLDQICDLAQQNFTQVLSYFLQVFHVQFSQVSHATSFYLFDNNVCMYIIEQVMNISQFLFCKLRKRSRQINSV